MIAELKNRLPSSTRILHTPVPLMAYPSSSGQHRTSHNLHSVEADDADHTSNTEASPEHSVILYIGGESLALTNLLLTHASYEVHPRTSHWIASVDREFSQVYSYDPKTRMARLESGRTNKLLMRRYAVVQRARDADVIGILVGTLGVGQYSAFSISQIGRAHV